ncbi:HD domain-containing protein [Spirillospora sp. NPDC049652]
MVSMDGGTALLQQLRPRLSTEELAEVERAHAVAERAHAGQYRRNGDPFITHPVQVALLAAQSGADHQVVCAALLHDVPEDTPVNLDELRARFGHEIADLVEGLDRLDRFGTPPTDERVLLLKVLDRLHNMRTLDPLPPAKRHAKALHTLEVLKDVAERVAPPPIAEELEALARARLGPGTGFQAVRLASLVLPPRARARYLDEWRAELAVLPRGRRAYLAELLLALPALAWILWRPTAARLLAVPLRTRLRAWTLVAPMLLWLTWQSARSGLTEAVTFVLTVVPVTSAALSRLRTSLGLADKAKHRPEERP